MERKGIHIIDLQKTVVLVDDAYQKLLEIEDLKEYDFSKAHITFFAAGSQISKEWAQKASKKLSL